MGIPVFWIEPTDRVKRQLRRYHPNDPCPGRHGYHNGHAPFAEGSAKRGADGCWTCDDEHEKPPHDDPRWPFKCDACGYVFAPEDKWQLFHDLIYVRPDTGESMILREAPPGAMYDATWYPWKGPDGISLMVVCPPDSHPWSVDSRASNCTLPEDNAHRCWVRHGDPRRDPRSVHVDKDGLTCAAGAGSIQTPAWHGFLHHGELVP